MAIFVGSALPTFCSNPYFYVVDSTHPMVIENDASYQFLEEIKMRTQDLLD
jgi:hypothetical protein